MSNKKLFGFLDNPLIKNFALSKLKKVVAENGIKCISITIDEAGEFSFTPYTSDVVILSKSDYNQLLKLASQ